MWKMLQNSGCKQMEDVWKRELRGSYLGLLNAIIKIIVYSAISGNHIYVSDTGYSYCFPDWHTHTYKHTHTHTYPYMDKIGSGQDSTICFQPHWPVFWDSSNFFTALSNWGSCIFFPGLLLMFYHLKYLWEKKREGEPYFW